MADFLAKNIIMSLFFITSGAVQTFPTSLAQKMLVTCKGQLVDITYKPAVTIKSSVNLVNSYKFLQTGLYF